MSLFVLYRDLGKMTNKSIKETEDSLMGSSDNRPTKVQEVYLSPKESMAAPYNADMIQVRHFCQSS